MYRMSQFKRFSNLNNTKMLAKENVVLTSLLVLPKYILARALSLKHPKTKYNKWLKIQWE